MFHQLSQLTEYCEAWGKFKFSQTKAGKSPWIIHRSLHTDRFSPDEAENPSFWQSKELVERFNFF